MTTNRDQYPYDIGVYVSSRNNYNMLENEVFNNLLRPNVLFVNVDDFSTEEQKEYGKRICLEKDVPFVENKKRGLQWAAKTAIDYFKENHPHVKYVVHFQHDIYPLEDSFYSSLQAYIDSGFLKDKGCFGFNIIDKDGRNTKDLYEAKVKKGKEVLGCLGVALLEQSRAKYYCSTHIKMPYDKWKFPFAVETTFWCCIGLNVDMFDKYIDVTDKYNLHLWGADINFQFLRNNVYNVALPDIYVVNHMSLKGKYGMASNSAKGARSGDEKHFGHYDHFPVFQKRFGFDWETCKKTFPAVYDKYKGTLMCDFFDHDISNGPLISWENWKEINSDRNT